MPGRPHFNPWIAAAFVAFGLAMFLLGIAMPCDPPPTVF